MIAFACAHCGMKFQVKEEFVGRTCRCTTCKHPLVVPPPDSTVAHIADGPIEGTQSSVAQTDFGCRLTLKQVDQGQPRTGQKSVEELLERHGKDSPKYVIAGEIARGGMGVVLRAVDCDIRREVAVKYLLDQSNPNKVLRFIEEVQITGQLEHPNIVPIHELCVDSRKRFFFSMKMVQGRSLSQVLGELRTIPKKAEKQYPLGRLLNVFVNVCNAVAYAHARGVVHRDLKPANIMLGDFGEVYVMDWGLAKVVHVKEPAVASPRLALPTMDTGNAHTGLPSSGTVARTTPGAPQAIPLAPQAIPLAAVAAAFSSTTGQVVTNRVDEVDLTQPGSVLGTPVYMAPEQARGDITDIDARSDVYSLGAILYEILALQPPVGREGGRAAVLYRVAEGQIQPPEERAPERARGGYIPRELSAVAMKALAREKADRYSNVEALRQDIERFQQGRSVSAKHDTFRELLWKLMKRNRAASVAATIILLILVVSLGVVATAWGKTRSSYAKYQKEQNEKEARTREAVPAFVKAARLAADRRDFDGALRQVNVALDYDDANTDGLLLKGQLLIVRQEFAAAGKELERYRRLKPDDPASKRLAELCQAPNPGDPATLLAFAQVFIEQKSLALADGLLTEHGKNSFEARKKLLKVYQDRIEKEWPGLGDRLTLDGGGIFKLNLNGKEQVRDVKDLLLLRGMPLTSLTLSECLVSDLDPLRGMPLTYLYIYKSPVSDLKPLQGLPLRSLTLHTCPLAPNLTPLQGLPLTSLNIHHANRVRDLTPLSGMKLVSESVP